MPYIPNNESSIPQKPLNDEASGINQQLSDFSIDGVIVFNEEQRLCYYNKAAVKFLNTTNEKLNACPNLKDLRKFHRIFEEISKLIFQLKKTKNATSVIKDQSSFFGIRCFEINSSMFGGKCYEAIIYDATELLEEQKEASKAEKINALTHFTNGIAHEINNPLAGISNALYLLKSGKLSSEKQIATLDKIGENINRITTIVDNLRLYARHESASESYINVSDAVLEVLDRTRSTSSSAVAEVEFTPSENKVEIFGPLNEFRQLMYNIVINAFQAMPNGGKLKATVSTVIDSGKRLAKITISDTGCGIAQEEIDYVFNPFYTRKRIWNSLGLGLSVAYRIAQCMHGDIDIKSEHNVGTTVTVIIPAA